MVTDIQQKTGEDSRNRIFIVAFFFALLTLLIASLGLMQLEKQLRQGTLDTLQTTLKVTHESIKGIWFKNLVADISVWVSDHPVTNEHIQILLSGSQEPDALVSNKVQQSLRAYFKGHLERREALGMFIIAPDYTNLSSMRDENIGIRSLIANWRPTYLEKAFQGKPQLVPPLPSDVALPDNTGQLVDNYPTMFILVPVKDKEHIIAVLAVRLNPFDTFSLIAQTGRVGESVETYFFDSQGLMVTESRFTKQLWQAGLIEQGKHSLLNVKLTDPGRNMIAEKKPASHRPAVTEGQPYTLMTQSALTGQSGSSLEAYRDYRGVLVLGAWLWDEELGLGFTTEMDEHEALTLYRSSLRIVLAMFMIIILLSFAFLYLTRRMQQQAIRTLANSEAYLSAVLKNAVDGIINIDNNGIIETFNQSAEDIFGYSAVEVLGKEIGMLMPKPDRKAHPEHIKNYTSTGKSKIMGRGRNLSGLRKDGSTFPLRIGLSDSNIEGRLVVTGMIQDLTEQNNKEVKLRNLTRAVAQSPSSVIITNTDGIIEYVNPAFTQISGYLSEDAIGRKTNILRSGHTPLETYKELWTTIKNGYEFKAEIINRKKSGEHFWQAISISPIRNDEGEIVNFLGVQEDISKRKQAEEELLRFRAALDSSADGIYLIDCEQMRFIDANRTGWQRLGYTRDELLGIGLQDLDLRYDTKEAMKKKINSLLKADNPYGTTHISENKRKDGTQFPVAVHLQPVDSDDSNLLVAVVHDETEHNQVRDELRQAKEEAETANQTKSDFLATMSHEIRTPMNAVIGMNYLALKTDLTDKQYNYISKAHDSAEQLLCIINDILDFSKIEAGEMPLESIDFNLLKVLDNTSNLLTLKAEKKGLEFIYDIAPDLPLTLIGDPMRLGQVLINLASNAIKFTEQGEVTIQIRVLEEKDQQLRLGFAVQDTGIGINPDHQQALFKAFSQADSSISRRYGGTGLGLVISKQLVEMMGGCISVSSELGAGSIFSFDALLTYNKGEAPQALKVPEDILKKRILVVDDNNSVRNILGQVLTNFGFTAETASSGLEALELLQTAEEQGNPFLLVLMDWQMPEMDGVATMRRIQDCATLSQPSVIIMITTYDTEELIHQAGDIKFDGTLKKPISPSLLLETILSAFGHNAGLITKHRNTAASAASNEKSLSGANILLVEDNELNQELALELLENANMRVSVANNGEEALAFLEETKFDCVLMDIQMPVMDGITASRKIREQSRFKDLPIIALTASAMTGDQEKALAAGMNDHIAKPIKPKTMMSTMAKWIRPSSPEADLNTVPATSSATISQQNTASLNPEQETKTQQAKTLPPIAGIDTQMGLESCNDDPIFYRRMLIKFRNREHDFIERFSLTYQSNDNKAATILAHNIKGLAGTFGAIGLHAASAELEIACLENMPSATVSALLKKVKVELDPVIQALQHIDEAPQFPENNTNIKGRPDINSLEPLLRDLARMLADADFAAQKKFEQLNLYQLEGVSVDELKKLQKNINEYDFEAALKTLTKLVLPLGLNL